MPEKTSPSKQKPACSITDCQSSVLARNWCIAHYNRWRVHGDPTKTLLHGLSRTPEYRAWRHIKDRTLNKSCKAYPDYGARGISICDKWRDDFKAFINDVGPRPTSKHSIERVDNDADYTPENCRWATKAQQQQNKRKSARNTSGYTGVCFWNYDNRNKKWIARIGNTRLGYFYTKKEAAIAYDTAALRIYGPTAKTNGLVVAL